MPPRPLPNKDKSFDKAERKRQARMSPDVETRRLYSLTPSKKDDDKKVVSDKSSKGGYQKLKNPAREADRRAFVRAELERKGMTLNPEGKRSVAEIAAREMARQKWAKQKKQARRKASSPSGEYGQSWMSE